MVEKFVTYFIMPILALVVLVVFVFVFVSEDLAWYLSMFGNPAILAFFIFKGRLL